MTDQQLIIAVAKLDGKLTSSVNENNTCFCEECVAEKELNYLTSRDAIIPVIEKQSDTVQYNTLLQLSVVAYKVIVQSPRALSIALVKATGNWEE